MSSFLLQCHTIELCRGIQIFFLSFAAQQLEIELSGEGRKEVDGAERIDGRAIDRNESR